MSEIENFILAAVCDGERAKLHFLYRWMKRIFLMRENGNRKVPVFYGSRVLWNAFESLIQLLADEGYKPLTKSTDNIDLNRQLFILLECNINNYKEVLDYVRKHRCGKIAIYVSEEVANSVFNPSEYIIFPMFYDPKISHLMSLLLGNFNKAIVGKHAPEMFFSSYIMKTTI